MPPPHNDVYQIGRPIPEIGARPGDYLVVRLYHKQRPVVLQRNLPLTAIRFVSDLDPATRSSNKDRGRLRKQQQAKRCRLRLIK